MKIWFTKNSLESLRLWQCNNNAALSSQHEFARKKRFQINFAYAWQSLITKLNQNYTGWCGQGRSKCIITCEPFRESEISCCWNCWEKFQDHFNGNWKKQFTVKSKICSNYSKLKNLSRRARYESKSSLDTELWFYQKFVASFN